MTVTRSCQNARISIKHVFYRKIKQNPFLKHFLRAKIQDLRRNIEVKKEAIITQNLRSTPKKNVDELKDELKTLEGARDARMGIYICIYDPYFYAFVNFPSYKGVERSIVCL